VDDVSIAEDTIAIACAGASNTHITLYHLPDGAGVRPLLSPSLRALRMGQ
jgi:hypothetical protein